MNKRDLIRKISYLPKLHIEQNVSLCEFLRETGYFEFHAQLNEKDIEDFLARNPECIELWLQYSDDQRVVETWYFLKSTEGAYKVAHNSKVGTDSLHEFSQPDKACAFFIKRIIEDIRRICTT